MSTPPRDIEPSGRPLRESVRRGWRRVAASLLIGLGTWSGLIVWAFLGPRLSADFQILFGVMVATEVAALAVLLSIYSYNWQLDEASRHINELQNLATQLKEASARDSLTGLYNHGYLMNRLQHEISRARRYGRTLAILIIDLNEFKRVNDELGHLAGDEVLTHVADAIRRRVRDHDMAARYGGDEFCLVLPETDAEGAEALVDALRTEMGALESRPGVPLRFGCGTATFPRDGSDVRSLFSTADERLYLDKSAQNLTEAS